MTRKTFAAVAVFGACFIFSWLFVQTSVIRAQEQEPEPENLDTVFHDLNDPTKNATSDKADLKTANRANAGFGKNIEPPQPTKYEFKKVEDNIWANMFDDVQDIGGVVAPTPNPDLLKLRWPTGVVTEDAAVFPMRSTGKLHPKLVGPGGGPEPTWKLALRVQKVDLDIDSDNTKGYEDPERDDNEDEMEDKEGEPGKFVFANTCDKNSDGVPDFADGIDKWGNEGTDQSPPFYHLILEINEPIDPDKVKIVFAYSSSDPNKIKRSGNQAQGYTYSLPENTGHLRIWTKDGGESRNKKHLKAGGDYVKPEVEYKVTDFPDDNKLENNDRAWRFYVEGVKASASLGDQRIEVKVDPDGDGPLEFVNSDAVRVTVVEVDLDAAGVSEENEDIADSNLLILVNNDDDDENGIYDFNETGLSAPDNDLAELPITLEPDLSEGTVKIEITAGPSNVNLWSDARKTTEITGNDAEWDLSTETLPSSVFVEGLSETPAADEVKVKLSLLIGGTEVTHDDIIVDVINLSLAPESGYYFGSLESEELELDDTIPLNPYTQNSISIAQFKPVVHKGRSSSLLGYPFTLPYMIIFKHSPVDDDKEKAVIDRAWDSFDFGGEPADVLWKLEWIRARLHWLDALPFSDWSGEIAGVAEMIGKIEALGQLGELTDQHYITFAFDAGHKFVEVVPTFESGRGATTGRKEMALYTVGKVEEVVWLDETDPDNPVEKTTDKKQYINFEGKKIKFLAKLNPPIKGYTVHWSVKDPKVDIPQRMIGSGQLDSMAWIASRFWAAVEGESPEGESSDDRKHKDNQGASPSFNPTNRQSTTKSSGEAEIILNMSKFGGDNYIVHASGTPSPKITIWRKVWVEVDGMKNKVTTKAPYWPILTDVGTLFEQVFLELVFVSKGGANPNNTPPYFNKLSITEDWFDWDLPEYIEAYFDNRLMSDKPWIYLVGIHDFYDDLVDGYSFPFTDPITGRAMAVDRCWGADAASNAANYGPYNTAHEMNHYFVENRGHNNEWPWHLRSWQWSPIHNNGFRPAIFEFKNVVWDRGDLLKIRSKTHLP